MTRRILKSLDAATDWMGRIIAWLSFAMMITTVVVVVLRYGFDLGAIMLQEAVVYMHGIMFMLGIAYTVKVDAHVRVDLVYSRLSMAARQRINVLGHVLFLLPVSAFIFVVSLDYVAASWRVLEGSAEVGGLPAVYLLKTLIPLMAATLFGQGLIEIARGLVLLHAERTALSDAAVRNA